jgi:hypothetical protein
MLKLLILFPFIVGAGAIALALLVPLLAVVPILLIVGLAIALPLLILRVLFAVFCGLGHVLFGLIGVAAAMVGVSLLLVAGIIGAHLLLPLLVLAGVIWFARRAARPAPLMIEHRPS